MGMGAQELTLLAERPTTVETPPEWLRPTMAKLGIREVPEQSKILNSGKRQILVAGGEQGGKSNTAATYWLMKYLKDDTEKVRSTPEYQEHGRTNLLYWLVGFSYSETTRELNYIYEWCKELGLVKGKARGLKDGIKAEITLIDGTRIQSKSAETETTLSKEAPDGIIGCEASQLPISTYNRMRGRITPRKGWLFLAGTFESSIGWYPQLYTAWKSGYDNRQSFSLPSWTNPVLYPGGRNDPEILELERDSSDDFFMERISGEPVPPAGLVHDEIRADIHVQEVPYVKGAPIWLGIDPGIAHAYAVEVFQEINGQEVIIDEIYEQNKTTEEIIDIAKTRRWWKEDKTGVIDISANARNPLAAGTISDVWLRLAGLALLSNKVPINDGIERVKTFTQINAITGKPKLVINPHCVGILSEFGMAPSPFDGQTHAYAWKTDREGNRVGDTPIDKYNDGVKGTTYMLVEKYGFASARRRSNKFLTRTAY